MSEDVARAVGAGLSDEIMIAGKACRLRPLTIKELTEIEREGVRVYRRRYLEALKDSSDLLPGGAAGFEAAVEKSAHWDADDLPKKTVYDVSNLNQTALMKKWLIENLQTVEEKVENLSTYHRLVAASLDSGLLSEAEFTAMIGRPPRKTRTGYINWWVTGTPEGMCAMIWHALKEFGVTRDEINQLASDPSKMMVLSREIESLSVPDVGNG